MSGAELAAGGRAGAQRGKSKAKLQPQHCSQEDPMMKPFVEEYIQTYLHRAPWSGLRALCLDTSSATMVWHTLHETSGCETPSRRIDARCFFDDWAAGTMSKGTAAYCISHSPQATGKNSFLRTTSFKDSMNYQETKAKTAKER